MVVGALLKKKKPKHFCQWIFLYVNIFFNDFNELHDLVFTKLQEFPGAMWYENGQ